MKRTGLFLGILLMISGALTAQERNYRFERINTDNGLSKNNVFAIIQDRQGFMWFVTDYGLNRFDGYDFKNYFHDPEDTTSLANNYVNGLLVDHAGNLWVGTNGYLHLYSPEKDNFKRIPLRQRKKQYQGIQLASLVEDNAGNIWVGDYDRGIYKYVGEEDKVYDYSDKVENLGISSIYRDRDGILWIGADMGKVFRYDPANESFSKYENTLVRSDRLHDDYVWFIRETGDPDIFLVGSQRGLFDFNKRTGTFSIHPIAGINAGEYAFTCYYRDTAGTAWYGTAGQGLLVDNGKVLILERKPDNMRSLSNNEIHDIFRDRSGVYWIATMGGVNKLDPALFFFSYFQYNSNDPYSLRFNNVSSFCEDEKQRIWVGTQGEGVNIFFPETGKFSTARKV